jgi:hypothetical protein
MIRTDPAATLEDGRAANRTRTFISDPRWTLPPIRARLLIPARPAEPLAAGSGLLSNVEGVRRGQRKKIERLKVRLKACVETYRGFNPSIYAS